MIWLAPGFTGGITEQRLHQKSHHSEERDAEAKQREPSVRGTPMRTTACRIDFLVMMSPSLSGLSQADLGVTSYLDDMQLTANLAYYASPFIATAKK